MILNGLPVCQSCGLELRAATAAAQTAAAPKQSLLPHTPPNAVADATVIDDCDERGGDSGGVEPAHVVSVDEQVAEQADLEAAGLLPDAAFEEMHLRAEIGEIAVDTITGAVTVLAEWQRTEDGGWVLMAVEPHLEVGT